MALAIDATVVREPLSGVHYAVRSQTLALIESMQEAPPVVFATDPAIRSAATTAGCTCPPLPQRLRHPGWRILWQQMQLPKLLRENGCDHLLALAYTAPLKCPIPYTVQVHDTIALDYPELCSRKNALHFKALLPKSMRNAKQIIVTSAYVRDRVLAHTHMSPDSIHQIPLAIDDIYRQGPPSLPDDLVQHKPYILFVGNIEPKKGVDTLLEAYARLDGDRTLVIVGREGWKSGHTIRRIRSYSGPGKVVELGYVERSILPALYANAAVTVLPSIVEGFGLPVLEALAMGSPVIHSDHPTLMETAGGFGHPFPTGDPAALAEAIAKASGGGRNASGYARKHKWTTWASTVAAVVQDG